jgi:hypothetical protein
LKNQGFYHGAVLTHRGSTGAALGRRGLAARWQLKRVFRAQLKMPGNLAVSGHFLQRWWPGTESNHRHADFQSAALPTELPGHEERKYIKVDYVAQVLFGTFLL